MSVAVDASVALGAFSLDVELRIEESELLAVVGPNGAGKTTLLRAIAGLEPVHEGRIVLGGRTVDDPGAARFVRPERRSVGVVFQDRRLLPASSVLDNVAFGVRARGRRRDAARREARIWLDRLGVAALAARRPRDLSGGEAQRVAVARALASDPDVVLLDEPFASVDAADRHDLRTVVASVQRTRLLVTHDPLEAMALGDRVAVLERGRVVQIGTPDDIRSRPRSRYAAALVGTNLLRGRARGGTVTLETGGHLVAASPLQGDVLVAVHPRAIGLFREPPAGTPRNVLEVTVRTTVVEDERLRIALAGPIPLVAEITRSAADELDVVPGARLWAVVKATELDVYPT